jgi:hypothetical protein
VFARVAAILVFASAVALSAQPRFSKQDALRFQTKLAKIEAFAAAPARASKTQSIDLTDAEVTSYLRYGADAQVPAGITEPTLTALGNGRVAGRAIVDLDAIRQQKQRGWTDPTGYLTGKLPVTATGTLTTSKGIGRFQLETAAISGIAVPKFMLQELLSYYSRTPEAPNGIDMDAPFELPARIREIRVGTGTATVVQ